LAAGLVDFLDKKGIVLSCFSGIIYILKIGSGICAVGKMAAEWSDI